MRVLVNEHRGGPCRLPSYGGGGNTHPPPLDPERSAMDSAAPGALGLLAQLRLQ